MSAAGTAPGRERELVFPLIPSRRSVTLDVVGRSSRRRGSGGEVAGSRPYRRGDPIRLVDWRASARLSTARASDEFVVRDRLAEDVVRVVVVADRGRSMRLFPAELPWLHKPEAVREAGQMIVASAAAANALVGHVAVGRGAPRLERPARSRALRDAVLRQLAGIADGPVAGLEPMLELLTRSHADVPPGTFVFVLSDFLEPPSPHLLGAALGAGWDLVPVIVQDPVWERSFPDVSGVTVPLASPTSGTARLVRLRREEARERRAANELRACELRDTFRGLGVDPVLVTSSRPTAVHAAFLAWADARTANGRRLE
jgi:uncharacterized protein (DUF58 family)